MYNGVVQCVMGWYSVQWGGAVCNGVVEWLMGVMQCVMGWWSGKWGWCSV